MERSISHISGPKLPQNLFQMATVTNPEKNGLLVVGGYSKVATVVCKIVHKFASVWCKTALGEVGVSLP